MKDKSDVVKAVAREGFPDVRIAGKQFPLYRVLDFKPYRKKPVIVMALQINDPFTIKTLEGPMKGNAGDYLIRGVRGEYYPCKPDIFHETYELPDKPGGFLKLLILLGRFGRWFFEGKN